MNMNAQEHLRQAIDQQMHDLRAGVPHDREAAILALIRQLATLPRAPAAEPLPDLVTGLHLINLGGNTALRLCLESAGSPKVPSPSSAGDLADWAERFLHACDRLAEAELVPRHVETGFMRLVDDGDGAFDAWIATKHPPTSWQERADFAWWASSLDRRHASTLSDTGTGVPGDATRYRQMARIHAQMMAHQLGYPPDAEIGGCSIRTCCDVLEWLIARALQARDRGEAPAPQLEHSLVTALASDLAIDPAVIGPIIAAFTLDRENATWHAAVPGIAAAPLVRIAPDTLAWSSHGLTTEPLLFLTRELRRRDAQAYHNAAHLREDVFRNDLYRLFQHNRFVTSAGRIRLRRDTGKLRTDIDAAIFDRKTGTLGLFELKSQDPFARSTAELIRQRDNFLYASRQVSGILDWLNRHGGDEILNRIDSSTAKHFRVHKVYPFVLGRYLAHFSDGPRPDRRAAWGTWPQLLRLLDDRPISPTDANPIASLFARLTTDNPAISMPADGSSREITIGSARLVVHPSYAAYQAAG